MTPTDMHAVTDLPVIGAERAVAARLLPLDIAFSDYDRTRPLVDRRALPAGIEPTYTTRDIGDFCHRPVYEEFDAAEMSLSWYVAARGRGEPVIALPIFPLRMPVQAYMYTRSDAPYTSPTELRGKRIGVMGYRFTVMLWLRGIIEDTWGVRPSEMTWVSTLAAEGAGFVYPKDVPIEVRAGADPQQLLLDGDVDAVFSPVVLQGIIDGDPRLRRLLPDARAACADYYAATKIFPITHTIVVGEALLRREPWIAASLVDAFERAQELCDRDYAEPKFLSAPDAVLTLEAARRDFGSPLYAHRLAPNRHVLETFLRYAHAQGYIARPLDLDTLFAPLDPA
jgi:4,5-dihydroxyphthalate decarboxylase